MSFIYKPDDTALMDETTKRTMYNQPIDAKVVAAIAVGGSQTIRVDLMGDYI